MKVKQGGEVQVEYLSLMMKNASEEPATKLESSRSTNAVTMAARAAAEAIRVKEKGVKTQPS